MQCKDVSKDKPIPVAAGAIKSTSIEATRSARADIKAVDRAALASNIAYNLQRLGTETIGAGQIKTNYSDFLSKISGNRKNFVQKIVNDEITEFSVKPATHEGVDYIAIKTIEDFKGHGKTLWLSHTAALKLATGLHDIFPKDRC